MRFFIKLTLLLTLSTLQPFSTAEALDRAYYENANKPKNTVLVVFDKETISKGRYLIVRTSPTNSVVHELCQTDRSRGVEASICIQNGAPIDTQDLKKIEEVLQERRKKHEAANSWFNKTAAISFL